ncbi:78 kDa glucose-regulated protein, partial [Orchesella cincta]
RFSLNEKVLEELLFPFKNRKVTTRLAILSFTGPPQSGKSFYTNLLSHYLDSKSFEWLTELSNQKATDTKPLQGFHFGAVTGTEYVVSDTSESGIYVWPKLFSLKTYSGNLAVCILHQHQSPTDRAEQPNIHLKFNYLLHTICSRIIEIRQHEDKFTEYAPDNLANTDVFRLELVSNIEADNVCVDFINSRIQGNRIQTNSDHFHENDNASSQNGDAELKGRIQQLDGYQQRGENDYEARSLKPDEDAEKAAEMARITEAKEKARIAEAQAKRAKEEAEKAKENARKAEEEKIQLFVNDACTQVEPRIVSYLENWLNGHSILSSIDYFESIYRCSIDEILSPKLLGMLKMHRVRIRMLLGSRSNSMKTDLEKIHEIITGFHSLVYKHMETHICFPDEQILNELHKFIPVKKLNGTIIKYAEFGCKKLESIYVSQNELIVASECGLSSFCKDKIFKAYNEEMAQSLAISPCHPTRLTQTYQTFLKFVHAQLEPMKEFQGNLVGETSFLHVKKWKELEISLKQIYIKHRLSNAQKLKQLYNLVKPTVLRYKGEYCNEIEKILKESPNGIPKETLFMQNVAVHDTVKAKLCQEIRSIIGDNEPTEGYLKSLSCEIESVWLAFEDLNNERLTAYCKKIKSATPIPSERKSLPPILFQLSLSRIGTYIYNEQGFVNFGYSSTTVGETCDGILVCVNQNSSQADYSKFERSWKLSDLLFPEQKNTDEIVVEGSSHKIQTELILGLLLSTLKQRVETRQNGDAKACVISVPFWLTSQQRQQVKDGGRIAGFEDTFLINENSAIALYVCSSSTDEEQNEIVVLSENSGWVDSTIYSYDKFHGCVKTTGHCGTYETSKQSLLNASITQKISESYKIAQKTNDEKLGYWKRGKPKTVAFAHESEKYKNYLLDVGKYIANTKETRVDGDIMIIEGAHIFSKNLRTKQISLQDWLSASVHRKVGENKEELIQEKKDYNLHSEIRNVSSSFHLLNEVAYFFQKDVNGRKTVFADIKLSLPSAYKKKTEVNLVISSESIINTTLTNTCDVILNQRRLDATQIAVYTSVLVSLQKMKVEIEKNNKRKQELIQQGSILLKRASTGQFKSALAQEMALQQIREALKLLSHPKITASDTEKQTELKLTLMWKSQLENRFFAMP